MEINTADELLKIDMNMRSMNKYKLAENIFIRLVAFQGKGSSLENAKYAFKCADAFLKESDKQLKNKNHNFKFR